jgi:uncharacterized protein (TIGR03435 family)
MQLIIFAWDIYPPFSASPKDQLVGAPKWLDSVYFEVIAKASAIDGPAPLDHDDVRSMLRALLVDRFKLATHYEDRPVDVYTLVATKPTPPIAQGVSKGAHREQGTQGMVHRQACSHARTSPWRNLQDSFNPLRVTILTSQC